MNFHKLRLQDHLRILLKHKRIIIASTAVCTLVVTILAMVSKPSYRSTVALEVADDAVTRLLTSDIDVSPDLTVGNYMDILTSQSFCRGVIQAIRQDSLAQAVLFRNDKGESWLERMKLAVGIISESLSQDEAEVIKLSENLSTDHRGGRMIRVTVLADDRDEAYFKAKAVGEEFTKLNLETIRERIDMLGRFYAEQLEQASDRMLEAEMQLIGFKQSNNITSADRETARLSNRLVTLESQLAEVSSQHRLVKKQMATLDSQLENLEDDTPILARLETQMPRVEELKRRLIDLQTQYNTQAALYTSKHPKIQGMKREIDATVQELRNLAGNKGNGDQLNSHDPVVVWHDLYIERLLAELELNGLAAKEEGIQSLVTDYRQKLLREVPEKEQEFVRLQRNVQVAQDAYQAMLSNNEKIHGLKAEKALNVNIIEPAERPLLPLPRKRKLKIIAGLILGFAIGVGCSYLVEAFDQSLKTTKDVESQLRLPIAGHVFNFAAAGVASTKLEQDQVHGEDAPDSVLLLKSPASEVSENFRALRTHVDTILAAAPARKVVMVTSPGPGEGKTTVALNLAACFTLYGKKTLLLDTDIYNPTAHSRLGISQNFGLSNWLAGEIATDTMLSSISLNGSAMDVIPTGSRSVTFQKVATNSRMKTLLEELRDQYDIILIDAPPIIPVSDPLLIAPHVDLVLLVIESGHTQMELAGNAAKMLVNAKAPAIYAVLNKLDPREEYGLRNYLHVYRHGQQTNRLAAAVTA